MRFLEPLLTQETGEDFPSEVDIPLDVFHKLKRKWKLWHATGQYNSNGSFVPAIDFFQARSMPKDEIDFYLIMDNLLAIRQRQEAKKKQK